MCPTPILPFILDECMLAAGKASAKPRAPNNCTYAPKSRLLALMRNSGKQKNSGISSLTSAVFCEGLSEYWARGDIHHIVGLVRWARLQQNMC